MKNAFLFLFVACLSFSGLFVGACTLDAPSDNEPPGGGDAGSAGMLGKSGAGSGGAPPSSIAGAAGAGLGGAGTSGAAGSATSGAGGGPGCSASEKSCDGACVEIDDPKYGCDATLCSAAACPQTPGAQLACEAGQCVLGSCAAGKKKCGEECVAIDDPAYGCGAASCDATACPSQGTGGTVVCEGSACVIGTCPANYKKCGGKCVAVSDPTYGCGATTCDATACPAAGGGTLVCQASACVVGTCGAGTKKCGDKCVTIDANNGCADAARCTPCANNQACAGSPTTCQCVPTPMATACTGKCGSVSNGCGGTYTCSGCTSPQTCGGGGTANVCGCAKTAMATACSGKNCGTAADGCGETYTCGTCTSPQTCAGGGTANVCGCTMTSKATACSGKTCGTAADGCGGTHTCGSCSGGTPVCVTNSCKQCTQVSHCPVGTFNCTNNVCKCRVPMPANHVTNGGFDSTGLSGWSSGTRDAGDRDNCPASGSLVFTSSILCVSLPTLPAATNYTLGFQFKSAGDVGCIGTFYLDTACQVSAGVADFFNMSTPASSDWSLSAASAMAPSGTSSIKVDCSASGGASITMDQVYVGPAWTVSGQYF